jgi:hypothetical protein
LFFRFPLCPVISMARCRFSILSYQTCSISRQGRRGIGNLDHSTERRWMRRVKIPSAAIFRKRVYFNGVSMGFLQTQQTPILARRDFSAKDTPDLLLGTLNVCPEPQSCDENTLTLKCGSNS